MKKRCVLLALIVAACWGAAPAAEFGYPVAGEPWYSIRAGFTDVSALSKGAWRVSRVSVNGARVRDFVLYQDGRDVLGAEIRGESAFELKARFGWRRSQSYDIQVELENPRTKKTASLVQKVTSPGLRGYWNPDWKNFLA